MLLFYAKNFKMWSDTLKISFHLVDKQIKSPLELLERPRTPSQNLKGQFPSKTKLQTDTKTPGSQEKVNSFLFWQKKCAHKNKAWNTYLLTGLGLQGSQHCWLLIKYPIGDFFSLVSGRSSQRSPHADLVHFIPAKPTTHSRMAVQNKILSLLVPVFFHSVDRVEVVVSDWILSIFFNLERNTKHIVQYISHLLQLFDLHVTWW